MGLKRDVEIVCCLGPRLHFLSKELMQCCFFFVTNQLMALSLAVIIMQRMDEEGENARGGNLKMTQVLQLLLLRDSMR